MARTTAAPTSKASTQAGTTEWRSNLRAARRGRRDMTDARRHEYQRATSRERANRATCICAAVKPCRVRGTRTQRPTSDPPHTRVGYWDGWVINCTAPRQTRPHACRKKNATLNRATHRRCEECHRSGPIDIGRAREPPPSDAPLVRSATNPVRLTPVERGNRRRRGIARALQRTARERCAAAAAATAAVIAAKIAAEIAAEISETSRPSRAQASTTTRLNSRGGAGCARTAAKAADVRRWRCTVKGDRPQQRRARARPRTLLLCWGRVRAARACRVTPTPPPLS